MNIVQIKWGKGNIRDKEFIGSGALLAYKTETMKSYTCVKLVFELTSSQSKREKKKLKKKVTEVQHSSHLNRENSTKKKKKL